VVEPTIAPAWAGEIQDAEELMVVPEMDPQLEHMLTSWLETGETETTLAWNLIEEQERNCPSWTW